MARIQANQHLQQNKKEGEIVHEIQIWALIIVLSIMFIPFLMLTILGCATTQPLQTQSGRPEVTIYGVEKSTIKDMVVSALLEKGPL